MLARLLRKDNFSKKTRKKLKNEPPDKTANGVEAAKKDRSRKLYA